MNKNIPLILCLLLSSCAAIAPDLTPDSVSKEKNMPASKIAEPNSLESQHSKKKAAVPTLDPPNLNAAAPLTNIRYVYNGMTLKEVKTIMGNYLIIGQQNNPKDKMDFKPIKLRAPIRKEVLKLKETYTTLFYFTQIVKTDGMIAEDELTPLIFKNNKLIGKGHNLLFKLKDE